MSEQASPSRRKNTCLGKNMFQYVVDDKLTSQFVVPSSIPSKKKTGKPPPRLRHSESKESFDEKEEISTSASNYIRRVNPVPVDPQKLGDNPIQSFGRGLRRSSTINSFHQLPSAFRTSPGSPVSPGRQSSKESKKRPESKSTNKSNHNFEK